MARVIDDPYFASCSTYVNKLDSTARARYKFKLSYDNEKNCLPDPYTLPNWINNPSEWPDLSFGDIYIYLIETPSQFDKKSLKAYKSLEAFNYFISGHGKTIWYHPVSERSPFCFIKADVIPSQRISQKQNPWVCLHKDDGSVKTGHCDCMARLEEACSHVAALLFKVEAAVKLGLTKESSTSQVCTWNQAYRVPQCLFGFFSGKLRPVTLFFYKPCLTPSHTTGHNHI